MADQTAELVNFVVKKADDGACWVCTFTLYDQEHSFTGTEPIDAVAAAMEFLKTKGTINSTEIVRA